MVQRLEAEGAEVILKLCESFSVDGVELGSASRTNNYSINFTLVYLSYHLYFKLLKMLEVYLKKEFNIGIQMENP